jgi:hypothetical protein
MGWAGIVPMGNLKDIYRVSAKVNPERKNDLEDEAQME